MGTQTFPTGTVTAFRQTSAPYGWVKQVSLQDYSLRIVSGVGGTTGGTNDFSGIHPANSSFQTWTVPSPGYGPSTSDATLAEFTNHAHNVNLGAPNSSYNGPTTVSPPQNVPLATFGNAYAPPTNPDGSSLPAGSGFGHSHSVTISVNGSVGLNNWSLQYLDVIIAAKA